MGSAFKILTHKPIGKRSFIRPRRRWADSMERLVPEFQCGIHKSCPYFPILSRIYQIPCMDSYFFKIHSGAEVVTMFMMKHVLANN
jgi:hypothetical protein